MRISANDIKSGNILDYEGELWVVWDITRDFVDQ